METAEDKVKYTVADSSKVVELLIVGKDGEASHCNYDYGITVLCSASSCHFHKLKAVSLPDVEHIQSTTLSPVNH